MPLITPTPTQDEYRLRFVNIRTANGVTDRGPTNALLPAGSILAVVVFGAYQNGTWLYDLSPITIEDVAAWVTELVAAGDPLAATAVAWFDTVDSYLKNLAALRGSQLGLCARPAE